MSKAGRALGRLIRVADGGSAAILRFPTALMLVACVVATSARAGERTGTVSEGNQVYQQACAACHGVNGQGHGPVAAALVHPPPDLTLLAAQHGGAFPRGDVVAVISGERSIISHGTRELPVWSQRLGTSGGGTTGVASIYIERQLQLLASFLDSLQRPAPPAEPTDTPER